MMQERFIFMVRSLLTETQEHDKHNVHYKHTAIMIQWGDNYIWTGFLSDVLKFKHFLEDFQGFNLYKILTVVNVHRFVEIKKHPCIIVQGIISADV